MVRGQRFNEKLSNDVKQLRPQFLWDSPFKKELSIYTSIYTGNARIIKLQYEFENSQQITECKVNTNFEVKYLTKAIHEVQKHLYIRMLKEYVCTIQYFGSTVI